MFDETLTNCPYCGMPNENSGANSIPVQEVNSNNLNVESQIPNPNNVILEPNVPNNTESVIQPVVPNPEVPKQVDSSQSVQTIESTDVQLDNNAQPTEIVKSDTILTPTNIMQEISVDDLSETELNNANLEVVSSNAPTESLNVEEKKIELPPMPDALIEDVDVSILGNKYDSEEEENNQRLLEKQRIEAEKQRIENEKRELELAKKMQVKPDLLRIDNPTQPPDQIAMMPEKKSNKKIIIIVAICVVVLIVAVLAFLLLK